MKRRFNVVSSKSLNRRQPAVIVVDFAECTVSFHKLRKGQEVKRVFPATACVKLEKHVKDSSTLTVTFSHLPPVYRKTVTFQPTATSSVTGFSHNVDDHDSRDRTTGQYERDLFCDVIHGIIVTGNKALKVWKSLHPDVNDDTSITRVSSSDAPTGATDGDDSTADGVTSALRQENDFDFATFLISFSSAETGAVTAGAHADATDSSGIASQRNSTISATSSLISSIMSPSAASPNPQLPSWNRVNSMSSSQHTNTSMQQWPSLSQINDSSAEQPAGTASQLADQHSNAFSTQPSTAALEDEPVNDIDGMPLLHGEQVIVKQPHVTQMPGSNGWTQSSRGDLYLTNYRLIYRDYATRRNRTQSRVGMMHDQSSREHSEQPSPTTTADRQSYTAFFHAALANDQLTITSSPQPHIPERRSNGRHHPLHLHEHSCELPLGLLSRVIRSVPSQLRLLSKDYRKLEFAFDASAGWVETFHRTILLFAFPKEQSKLFAFLHHSDSNSTVNDGESRGWHLYDAEREYMRIGLLGHRSPVARQYRLSTCNETFGLCSTYPQLLVVPSTVDDTTLRAVSLFRSKERIPAACWLHPITHAALIRCAQPLPGVRGKRSEADEQLLAAYRLSNNLCPTALHIIDARPYRAAMGNTMMGKGTENTAYYPGALLEFCNIENIHAVRQSLDQLMELIYDTAEQRNSSVSAPNTASAAGTPGAAASASTNSTSNNTSRAHPSSTNGSLSPPSIDVTDSRWLSRLDSTQWLYHVRMLLVAAVKVATTLTCDSTSVVVHCSDGWDRTSQMVSLVQLMLDPYYRTLHGFAVLIEKEWLSFGHRFSERHGHADPNFGDDQRAPIFAHFLDAVWQICRQFPAMFQFNDQFLIDLLTNSYDQRFGTFLFDSVRERQDAQVRQRTISVWSHMLAADQQHRYLNELYEPLVKLPHVISSPHRTSLHHPAYCIPSCSPRAMQLWESMYMRHTSNSGLTPTVDPARALAVQLKQQLVHQQQMMQRWQQHNPRTPPKYQASPAPNTLTPLQITRRSSSVEHGSALHSASSSFSPSVDNVRSGSSNNHLPRAQSANSTPTTDADDSSHVDVMSDGNRAGSRPLSYNGRGTGSYQYPAELTLPSEPVMSLPPIPSNRHSMPQPQRSSLSAAAVQHLRSRSSITPRRVVAIKAKIDSNLLSHTKSRLLHVPAEDIGGSSTSPEDQHSDAGPPSQQRSATSSPRMIPVLPLTLDRLPTTPIRTPSSTRTPSPHASQPSTPGSPRSLNRQVSRSPHKLVALARELNRLASAGDHTSLKPSSHSITATASAEQSREASPVR